MIDVMTMGETMALLRHELPENPSQGSRFILGFGGADSNVAIGLARLGHKSRWVSALGNDVFGQMIYKGIAEQGVDVRAEFSESHQTGLMVKNPSTSAERFVSFYRSGSAASKLSPESISAELVGQAKILHLTGITPSLSESCLELVRLAIKFAKAQRVLVSFDLNYRAALWSKQAASKVYRELAPKADIIFGDLAELSMLVEGFSDEEDLLQQIAAMGPHAVILKLGEKGALALIAGEIFNQGAFVVDVVDTVGAGDAFVAGYLSAYLDQANPEERLMRAAFCGAQACTNLGDWEGAAWRHELELARQELVK